MAAIVTGYYRYTDVMFEWHQVLEDPKDRSLLKAFLSPSSLISPENPLRKPGVNGIELWIGTMPDGESRLLFSSAQVEYIRYWLKAMDQTDHLIPLPASDYLLTSSSLTTVSPVVYESVPAMRAALKMITKNNKRLKGGDDALHSLRKTFEKVRAAWEAKSGAWIAIDFEAWEMDHSVVTEFGWSKVIWKDGKVEPAQDGHFIVKEHQWYTNGKYVKNNRDYFMFGDSEEVTKADLRKRVSSLIREHQATGPVYLVFHDYNQDLRYMKMLTIPIDDATRLLPDTTPDQGLYIVDTAELFAALEGDSNERRDLYRTCVRLLISSEHLQRLHNAGNDAHFTLLAMMSMTGGKPLDLQREERWPRPPVQDGDPPVRNGLKVEWRREEDSDFSDTEGILGLHREHDT